MNELRIKRGYSLNLVGAPSPDLEQLNRPDRVAVLPERIPFIKPRLKVAVEDTVKVGSVLFIDKRRPEITFLSPGGGKIAEINFGPRRVIREIVVALDEKEAFEPFPKLDGTEIDSIERLDLITTIINGGMWPLIRELPYRDIARPEAMPPAILVGMDAKEPFLANPESYLKGNVDLFRSGLRILRRLAGENSVHLFTSPRQDYVRQTLGSDITCLVSGPYPADDPGVMLYHTKTSSSENRAWFVQGQDVLMLARLFAFGRYPTERVVAVGGSAADRPRHFRTRLGVPLIHLAPEVKHNGDVRYTAGGLFRGYAIPSSSYLGIYETALNLVPEGNVPGELLGLFRPGPRKPTFSRAFTSRVHRRALAVDCNVHGGDRACIACGYCTYVCPVDILPQFTYKALYAGEVEEALSHGLLDCVECGLCSFVCPSKIDLYETFKQAKADVYLEQLRA
ncbi:Na(+)-translocating NADH-quinone reductase subunit A (EC [Olavius algarvensis associated proteobacterium Delta 3]|nr:Na(+)-translocating NADH-quinone reductase subunit A (EC [Olavius algarvensis associated proteobacterium Delta 3]